MMPIVEQSPTNHLHGHGHQTFYHQQHTPEQNNKMQLTLILPSGVPSAINVDANTPMMDLLVYATSLNKLNPSSYSLVVLDSNQHVINFKANQTVGQIVKSCHLPQINGSSTISLLPKESPSVTPSSKTKGQPFEITVRLQVNLPDAQKILIRVDPTLPLHEIKEQICKQKKYVHSNQYTLRLPNKLDQPLLLGLSLAEYKTNELSLIHCRQSDCDQPSSANQLQSFDRLYRTRSDSQPPKETLHDVQNEQQSIENSAKQGHFNQSSTLRPSHTSLHAYWNDPNFDTQSQISNSSSIAKKRRAPKPPGFTGANSAEPQIVYVHQQQPPRNIHSPPVPLRLDHHQSHESLQADNQKKKRKAPVVVGAAVTPNPGQKEDVLDKVELQNTVRPSLEPPPPPVSVDNTNEDFRTPPEACPKSMDEPPKDESIINSLDDQRPVESTPEQTPTNVQLVVPTNSLEQTHTEKLSPNRREQPQAQSPDVTPTLPQQNEQQLEQKTTPTNVTLPPPISSPVPKPPRQNLPREKKSAIMDGLIRIINDHTDRAHDHQSNNKPAIETNENVSYFRVAKSRYGKFETDNRGFVNNSIAIFDSTNQPKAQQQSNRTTQPSEISTGLTQLKPATNFVQQQTKGKQAYDMLKRYEKEEQPQSSNNTDYLKTTNRKDKSPTPIQLEVTERTTHITVTVESDRKQLITRASPVSSLSFPPPPPPPPPPILAPKPFGKTFSGYRTVRGVGDNAEPLSTERQEVSSVVNRNNKRLSTNESHDRLSNDSGTSHETLMESIRRFGGSQNLRKQ